MSFPDLDSTSGRLPLGRFVTTLDDVKARFVDHGDFVASATRPTIWGHFLDGLELLRQAVAVHAVWISGSFTSAKQDPNDVDCTFFLSAEGYLAASEDDRKVIEAFQQRDPGTTPGTSVSRHGIPGVDSFAVLWAPDPAPSPDRLDVSGAYLRGRGYWDDWWSRYRTGAKTDPIVREDVLPRRGYLEVILDGYA